MNKKVLIKAGIITAVAVIALAVPLLTGLMKISSVELEIQYPDDSVVINRQDIMQELTKKYGDFTSYKRNQVKTSEISDFLKKYNFVEKATVSVSMTGILRITVVQRLALVRVYTSKGQQYYIDSNMNTVNSQIPNQTADCFIASGNITDRPYGKIDTARHKDAYKIYKLALMLHQDSVLSEWIAAIVKQNKSWYLIPSQGDYTITLGDTSQWQQELEKLHYLFDYSFSKNGWADYENIDLRFHNQAVCSKRQQIQQ
ncbi:MAG: hypothetical protein IJ250_07745 [Bacteroidales bacterium]|nr:hypothetical protein [Bacteroidales bacterium]